MQICKYDRDTYDELKIKDKCYGLPHDQQYPRRVANSGTSSIIMVAPNLFFKRKQQDGTLVFGNYSMHHAVYQEEYGSFDDVAEVICYNICKNLGTRKITTNDGQIKEVPMINCAKYRLAEFITEDDKVYRGCTSENIISDPRNESLILGKNLLSRLSNKKVKNSLPNYLRALDAYGELEKNAKNTLIIDKNIPIDLILISFFCWKVSNSDNHSSNIPFLLKINPDGSTTLSVSAIIDNGSAWELSSPYIRTTSVGENKIEKTNFEDKTYNKLVEVFFDPTRKLNETSFVKHNAFSLDIGNLYGHSKTFRGDNYEYEYDLAALMLQNPDLYELIYNIEKNFKLEENLSETEKDFDLKWPIGFKEGIIDINNFKSLMLSTIVADYFTYSMFSTCVKKIDNNNFSQEYSEINKEMIKLPLQKNIDGYLNEFLKIATEKGINVDLSKIKNIKFAPNMDEIAENAKQLGGEDE